MQLMPFRRLADFELVLIASIVCKSRHNSLCRRSERSAYCPHHRASIWRHHRNRARQSDQLLPHVEAMRELGELAVVRKFSRNAARFQDWICALPFLHVHVQIQYDALLVICFLMNRITSVTLHFRFLHFLVIRLEGILPAPEPWK